MQAFIFDMDGVIIDSEPIHTKIIRTTLIEHNITISDEEFDKFIGMSSTAVFSHFIKLYNLPYTSEEMLIDHMTQFKNYIIEHHLRPIDGILSLIQNLKAKNIPLAIASSSPLDVIQFVSKAFNIEQYFQCIISGEDLPRSKPDPTIYLKTAQTLQIDPTQCVVLEDSTNGCIAAKNANMYCIGFINPNSGKQNLSQADITINKINDINLDTLY